MIFVTLGSQKFQFNRLLEKIDALVAEKIITEHVFAQIGYSDYEPQSFEYKKFMNRDEYIEAQELADIVIAHGGTGAIIGALKQGKKVIAIPRLEKYGEHVDNHQEQLVSQFCDMGVIEACYRLDELDFALNRVRTKSYNEYYSNTNVIIESIEKFLNTI